MTINSLFVFPDRTKQKSIKNRKKFEHWKERLPRVCNIFILENRVVLDVLEICASMIQEK